MTPSTPAPDSIVRRHLDAVWTADWRAMTATASADGSFCLTVGDEEHLHSVDELYNFYRFVSQAWDFVPGDVHIGQPVGGAVPVEMKLTNGGDWSKLVAGQYHVTDTLIDRIELTDHAPEMTVNG